MTAWEQPTSFPEAPYDHRWNIYAKGDKVFVALQKRVLNDYQPWVNVRPMYSTDLMEFTEKWAAQYASSILVQYKRACNMETQVLEFNKRINNESGLR